MSFKIKNASVYLKKALARKKKENRLYSLRSLARDLKVSPAFLSKVFLGQRPLPEKHLHTLCQRLGLDLREEQALAEALGFAKSKTKKVEPPSYELVTPDRASLFLDWYYPAICDLSTCSNFRDSPQWIARRLGISQRQADTAVEILLREGHLIKKDGVLKKGSSSVRLPAQKFLPVLRNFHQKWLHQAKEILGKQTDPESYARRSVHSITLAGNPEKLKEAQDVLTEALYRAGEILSEGKCTEVYHLGSVQLQYSHPVSSDD